LSNWDYASESELKAAREAYGPTDYKHPDYYNTLVDKADADRKRAKEEGPMELSDPALDQLGGGEIVLFTGNPGERMAQMRETAQIIAEPVRQRHTVKIGSALHVRVEGWTMLGSLLGVYPYTVWTRPLEDATETWIGWEARVEVRTRSGEVIGAAEAMCTEFEANWKGKDDYQLRSMAQTRAQSKALRGPLGFVVTLAGFEATPAEEMQSDFQAPFTSEGQRKLMYYLRDKLVKAEKLEAAQFSEQIKAEYGVIPSKLDREQTSAVIGRLQAAIEKHGLE
jgi:hypothetical protein